MKKIVKMFYVDPKELNSYGATGLIIELEDGTLLRHQSTDPIEPFSPFNPSKDTV